MQRDQFGKLLCKVGTLLGHTAAKRILGQHRVAEVVHLERLTKRLPISANATHRSATVVHAVIALLTTNKAGFCWLTFQPPVRARHLQ